MNTVSKLFVNPNANRLENVLTELVKTLNHRRQAVLNRYQVNELEVKIIHFLDGEEEKKMKEIGSFFNIKLSTLTSTIDKLERNKLVRRKNSKEDRRVIYIHPTPRGQNLLDELRGSIRKVSEAAIKSAKAPEFDGLIKGLETMLEQAKHTG
jgi:MarR family transcriptional regulator, organic hydroperoxide resistance regulator